MTYSAQVSASLQIGEKVLTVAKTGGAQLSLAEPSTAKAAEWATAMLTITVDGDADSQEVILVEGLKLGQQIVRYGTQAKDW